MTNKRRATLQSIHAREDEGLRRAMRAGIQAFRDGKAREDNPMHGHAWKRAWFGGYDYEAKKQIVNEQKVGADLTQSPALGE